MIRYPAPQRIAREALEEACGVPVSTQLPRNPPERFVVISRVGDSSSTFATADPRFLIEVYARGELDAEELAEQVRYAWNTMRSHGVLWSHDDRNLVRMRNPDTSGHHRFQFTGGLRISLSFYA